MMAPQTQANQALNPERAALSADMGALLERARHEVYHTEFLPSDRRFIPAATVVDLLALIDGFIEVLAEGEDRSQPVYSYCPIHGDLLAGSRSLRCAEAAPGHEYQ